MQGLEFGIFLEVGGGEIVGGANFAVSERFTKLRERQNQGISYSIPHTFRRGRTIGKIEVCTFPPRFE